MTPRIFAGIDGGGTRTTVALADEQGRELTRRIGPAGLVDPRRPQASVEVLARLVREAAEAADVEFPLAGLCAGLAGSDHAAERAIVVAGLRDAGIAEQVLIRTDGETALEGALSGGPGILLIAGTGSVGYGRAEDGRVDRCGGWGMWVGDEGSGYAIGRAALRAALRASDGRGAPTRLLKELLATVGLDGPGDIPSWIGRAEKSAVAALVPVVTRLATEGDDAASRILRGAAHELALHAAALVDRLGPWAGAPAVVYFGGVFGSGVFAPLLTEQIEQMVSAARFLPPAADAVTGALRLARAGSEPRVPVARTG